MLAPDPCTTAQLAADALSLLDHLALGPVDVLGLSLGGLVAQELALAGAARGPVEEVASARSDALDRAAAAFARLWREHPFYEPPALAGALRALVEDAGASQSARVPGMS